MNANIAQIKRIKITCKACKSEFILYIGKGLYECPVCFEPFHIDKLDDPFVRIKQALTSFENVKSAEIALICEEVQ